MEDNTNNINESVPAEEGMERRHYTKQQNALYTVISIALFFALYFGGGQILKLVNRPYNIYLTPETVSTEAVSKMYEISGLKDGLSVETARLSKGDGMMAVILFSGLAGDEEFAEACIEFEYGDPVEDVRIEFYPYADSPAVPEYAFGTQYVDIEHPNRSVSVFEFEDRYYAMYTEYGNALDTELKAVFKDGEKVY